MNVIQTGGAGALVFGATSSNKTYPRGLREGLRENCFAEIVPRMEINVPEIYTPVPRSPEETTIWSPRKTAARVRPERTGH